MRIRIHITASMINKKDQGSVQLAFKRSSYRQRFIYNSKELYQMGNWFVSIIQGANWILNCNTYFRFNNILYSKVVVSQFSKRIS